MGPDSFGAFFVAARNHLRLRVLIMISQLGDIHRFTLHLVHD